MKYRNLLSQFALATFLLGTVSVYQAEAEDSDGGLIIEIHKVNEKGSGESIGSVKVADTKYGLMLTPDLRDLEPGLHGFHIHQNPSCSPDVKDGKTEAALAAGGHLDTSHADAHHGPYQSGHLGDLPPLIVTADRRATLPVLAPRLKVSDIIGRSIMIHAGGDNFSDLPEKLGGGGGRVACGVIKENLSGKSLEK